MLSLLRFSLLAALLCVCPSVDAAHQDHGNAGVPQTAASAPPAEKRIDINRASMDELLKVPGLTRSWAERVVRYRPYRTKQDLLDRGVLTSQVYERIEDYVIAHREPK